MRKNSLLHKTFFARDGTKIGYQLIGSGKKIVVLCNGLGGTAIAWQPLYSKLSKKYTFIIWDYRGLFSSSPPKDPTQMTIKNHAQDLEDLLKHKKILMPIFLVGWSMGVQIALEFYSYHKKKVAGLVLLNGTSGSPFKTALRNPLSQFILPKINELAKKVVPHLQPHIRPLAKKVINWKGFIQIISRLGLVHPDLDTKLFRLVAHGMMNTDLTMYHEIMTHLGEHDATHVLPQFLYLL